MFFNILQEKQRVMQLINTSNKLDHPKLVCILMTYFGKAKLRKGFMMKLSLNLVFF